jgi:hypothetical protein
VAEAGGTNADREYARYDTFGNALKISLFQVFNITSKHEK